MEDTSAPMNPGQQQRSPQSGAIEASRPPLPPHASIPPRPSAADAMRKNQEVTEAETFWQRWGVIVMLACTLLILAALAWFGYSVYRYISKIQNGERIDISQFADLQSSSALNIDSQKTSSATAIDSIVNQFSDDPTYGNPNAKVTVVMFEDFECPYCGDAFPILRNVMQKYANDVQFVYRDFPLTSIHPNAHIAAEAANCARVQGKFWEYHDVLFTHQSALDEASLKKYAQTVGLDLQSFNQCFDEGDFIDEVDADFSDGVRSGVAGTPTFFVNGNRVQGVVSEDAFDQLIQYFLKQSGS